MKKFTLFILTALLALTGLSQVTDADRNEALQLVNANRTAIGLSADDLNNLLVTNTYGNAATGFRYVYLQQTYREIPVYNQLLVLAFRDGKLVSRAGELIPMIEQKVNRPQGNPLVTAASAVPAAVTDRKLTGARPAVILDTKDNGRKVIFDNLGIAQENISAQLMWYPVPETKQVRLIWQVYIIPATSSDYWLVRIDAENARSLGADNLTVYCNWDDPDHARHADHPASRPDHAAGFPANRLADHQPVEQVSGTAPALADNVTYRVVPFPAEAPSFPLGAHAVRTNPWTAALPNAGTLKWHSTAVGTDYNYTRGNNVWAYHDRTNLNTGDPARSATSTTSLPNLSFDFTPDYTLEPVVTSPPNQQFNITNLFYWNNIIHDVMYAYGFDEAGGNFQSNNLGRGGLGNDYVRAEAQDGGGTNNANFATPADGSLPRMQMYLWTAPTPDRDGDVDNGIIVHEYGHGISNRLTGGPATASCLGNAEQMGEGWSDYYTLMFTQDWATANLNTGFTSPRGIGTYAQNQPPSGAGIRTQRYCTDFSVNNRVYTTSLSTSPHNRGEIWCATLWDMTWNIIQQVGSITPSIYDAQGTGGNIIAMKLVTEGMKLQPCSPGFIDGRNAILQADLNLFGGAYQCAIKEAFRRRGMGEGASQGSSNNVNDQVPSFTGGATVTLTLLQSATAVAEGETISYTNRLAVGNCGDLVNHKITDILPANVSFVSATNGGTYNAANRELSWTVNQATNTTVDYNFVVRINTGAYYAPVNLLNETVTSTPPALPAGWSSTATPTNNPWVTTNTSSHSAPNSFFTSNLTTVNDQILLTTNSLALPATPPEMSFWGYINSEAGWDGGVVEISTNGGSSWSDLGANMTTGGYTSVLSSSTNPLSGRAAFNGNSNGFFRTAINLAPYAGQANVKFRFRFGSDASVAGQGWWVDDITIQDLAHVDMRSSLFNGAGVRLSYADAYLLINPPAGCTPPSVVQQPSAVSVCTGATASFTVGTSGTTPLTYQWEENSGGTWNTISNGGVYSGASTATLTLTGVTAGMNGYQYRCVVTGACTPVATSNAATLTISPDVTAGAVSGLSPICIGETTTYSSNGTAGGTWSSGNTSVATVNATTGVVSGVGAGTTTIVYTVSSGCGSPVPSSKEIQVTACSLPSVTCPGNIAQNAVTACSVSITVDNPTISNTTTLTWVMSGATTGSSPASGINYIGTRTFNIGTTTITYTATNGGGSVTCSFTVTVTDATEASITCPPSSTTTVSGKNKCSASISVPNPNTGSNCSVTKLTWAMTGDKTASSATTGINYVGTQTFPVGITTVTYTLTNGANNTATCSFTVTVKNSKCPGSPRLTGDDETEELAEDALVVKVLPNPSNTYFTLRIEQGGGAGTGKVEIAIYAINGKLVQRLTGNDYETFRFGDTYLPGTYIVKVKSGEKETTVKVVK